MQQTKFDTRAERKKKLQNKVKVLWIIAFAQVWLWPQWFMHVVGSSPVAVSSFLTMVGAVVYNICILISTHEKISNLWLDD